MRESIAPLRAWQQHSFVPHWPSVFLPPTWAWIRNAFWRKSPLLALSGRWRILVQFSVRWMTFGSVRLPLVRRRWACLNPALALRERLLRDAA